MVLKSTRFGNNVNCLFSVIYVVRMSCINNKFEMIDLDLIFNSAPQVALLILLLDNSLTLPFKPYQLHPIFKAISELIQSYFLFLNLLLHVYKRYYYSELSMYAHDVYLNPYFIMLFS